MTCWSLLICLHEELQVQFKSLSRCLCTAFQLVVSDIFMSRLTFIFPLSLWASLIYTPCAQHARIYIHVHRVIAWYQSTLKGDEEGGGSPGFCGARRRVWAGRESQDIFVGPQTFLVSFLLNSFDDWLWSGTRATVGGVSAAIFDVKDLHLR